MTTALITGANKGLGYETARQLGGLGWTIFVGARDPERGEHAVGTLKNSGADARLVPLDVTSDDSVAAAADLVSEATGGALDVLINNAGIIGAARTAPLETGPEHFLACFGVNLLGPVRVTRAMIPLLQDGENPRIVMVSSGLGSLAVTSDPERLESRIHSLVYPSSKAALNMVTTQYAKVLPGFRINAVDPGYTATDLNDNAGHQTVEEGATVIVAMAQVAKDGPTGGFFSKDGPVPW
jgi:NAD(P)-dependent dehydrogenase (short-subunit alcohol dehydrogenase family)